VTTPRFDLAEFLRLIQDHNRLRELIKDQGFQGPPAELEALVHTHPDKQAVMTMSLRTLPTAGRRRS
jgi:hypothetical protein